MILVWPSHYITVMSSSITSERCHPLQCLLFLEKELVSLGAMCAASLLKEDTVLPFAGTYVYEYQIVLYTCTEVYGSSWLM